VATESHHLLADYQLLTQAAAVVQEMRVLAQTAVRAVQAAVEPAAAQMQPMELTAHQTLAQVVAVGSILLDHIHQAMAVLVLLSCVTQILLQLQLVLDLLDQLHQMVQIKLQQLQQAQEM
jgi:hypothetical protein